VVDLVLQTPGEGSGAVDPDRLAVHVDAGDGGGGRPSDLGVLAGYGQAALGVGDEDALLGQVQDRVDHVGDGACTGGVGAVEHEDPGVDADLVGGQSDAVGGVHAGEHVCDELGEGVVEDGHLGAATVQHRGAVPRDGSWGAGGRLHGGPYYATTS